MHMRKSDLLIVFDCCAIFVSKENACISICMFKRVKYVNLIGKDHIAETQEEEEGVIGGDWGGYSRLVSDFVS